MLTRRHFLTGAGTVLGSVTALPAGDKPLLSFGLMADCQFVDAEPRGSRFYRESKGKLEEAIEELNRSELAFTLHLGDFIDRDFESFDVLDPVVSRLRSSWYHALGNHDFDVREEDRAKVPARLGLEKGYYSFRRDAFRFFVIDTTEVSTYRYPGESDETSAASAELERLKAAGSAAAKLTLAGMVETPDRNAFARADLHADRLEIIGHGRQESYTLVFR